MAGSMKIVGDIVAPPAASMTGTRGGNETAPGHPPGCGALVNLIGSSSA